MKFETVKIIKANCCSCCSVTKSCCNPMFCSTPGFPVLHSVPKLLKLMSIESLQFSSVAQSCPTLCDPVDCSIPGLPVHHQLPEFTQTPLSPLSQWCYPSISSSVIPFSSHFQSFPASGSFLMSQFFISSGQNIATSASASVLPMSIQDWSPLGWTGLYLFAVQGTLKILLQYHSSKHQFFGTQLSL